MLGKCVCCKRVRARNTWAEPADVHANWPWQTLAGSWCSGLSGGSTSWRGLLRVVWPEMIEKNTRSHVYIAITRAEANWFQGTTTTTTTTTTTVVQPASPPAVSPRRLVTGTLLAWEHSVMVNKDPPCSLHSYHVTSGTTCIGNDLLCRLRFPCLFDRLSCRGFSPGLPRPSPPPHAWCFAWLQGLESAGPLSLVLRGKENINTDYATQKSIKFFLDLLHAKTK